MSKYKNLSKIEIQEKIESGNFVKQEMVIRDTASGQIVKLDKVSKHESENYPSSFFQVNNNYVYQFDTQELIDSIKEIHLDMHFDELSDAYNTLLDYISMHKNIEDFSTQIYSCAVPLARSFQSTMARLLKDSDYFLSSNITDESVDRFLILLKAYVNFLFAYTVFLIIKQKNSSSVKSVIDPKIIELKDFLLPLYKHILLPFQKIWNQYSQKNEQKPDFNNSLYIKHYTNPGYDAERIELLIDFDDRFKSVGSLLKEASASRFSFSVESSSNEICGLNRRDHTKEIIDAIYIALVDIEKLEDFIHEFELLNLDDNELKDCVFSRLA